MEDKRNFITMLMNANMDFQVCGDDVAVPFKEINATIIFQFGTQGLFGYVTTPGAYNKIEEEDEDE